MESTNFSAASIRSSDRIQNNQCGSYFEVDIKASNSVTIGICSKDYPYSKRPGRSRCLHHQTTVGFDACGFVYLNGDICKDSKNDDFVLPNSLGCGYCQMSKTCFFTVNGILKCRL